MAGTFGYELDVTKLSEKEQEEVRRQIVRFRQSADLIRQGDYYRLSAPGEGCAAWAFAAPDGSEALVQAVFTHIEANPIPVHIRVPGLRTDARYRVELADPGPIEDSALYRRWFPAPAVLSGAALARGGLTLPPPWREYQSWEIRIRLDEQGQK